VWHRCPTTRRAPGQLRTAGGNQARTAAVRRPVFVDGVGAKALPAVMIAFAAVALIAAGLGRRAAFRPGR
jgi:hypothetical protein